MTASLARDLEQLPAEIRALLQRHHFQPERLLALSSRLARGERAENRVTGTVSPPSAQELRAPATPGSVEHAAFAAKGRELLESGQVAFCVMAGGMATRMGGVVKALVPIWPGVSFLDFRLAEAASWRQRYGRPVPLWLMTSDATNEPLEEALTQLRQAGRELEDVHTFVQSLSLRLLPDGSLFRDPTGRLSPYATGHGDLVEALRLSGLCERFVAAGGKYVWITNLDNLGATLDEALLGQFAASERPLAVEVVDKEPGDRGGIPVHHDGKLQVLEEFRLPEGFDAAQVRSFNTNTFLIRAEALQRAEFGWTYFEVNKKVGNQTVVQSERLLQEMTASLDTLYLRVPREGVASRFLPIKDHEELVHRRPALLALAEHRGLSLPA